MSSMVRVPTPVDRHKRPDLSLVVKASEVLGKVLDRCKRSDIQYSA